MSADGNGTARRASEPYTTWRTSREATEAVFGAGEAVNSSNRSNCHNAIAETSSVGRVGPWPLKRNSSSATTIVGNPTIEPGSEGSAKTAGPDEKTSDYSRLLALLDDHCEYVQRIIDGDPSLLEDAHAQWRKEATTAVDESFDDSQQAERAMPRAGARDPSEDVECGLIDGEHDIATCCQRCTKAVERQEHRMARLTWAVTLCGIMGIISTALFAEFLQGWETCGQRRQGEH